MIGKQYESHTQEFPLRQSESMGPKPRATEQKPGRTSCDEPATRWDAIRRVTVTEDKLCWKRGPYV